MDNLYHGSPIAGIRSFTPLPSEVLNGESVVFAGERWMGVSCVNTWSDLDFIQGTSNGKPFMQEVYKNAFKTIYKTGGFLYTVPKSIFRHDHRICDYEYITTHAVSPTDEKYIADPILELTKLGVELIKFVTPITALHWK